MQMSGDKSISAFPETDNLFKWIGTINGPQETVSAHLMIHMSLMSFDYMFITPGELVNPQLWPAINNTGCMICLRCMMDSDTGFLLSFRLVTHIRLLVSNLSLHVSIPTLMIRASSVSTSWRINGQHCTMCVPSCCRSRVCWEVMIPLTQ